MTISGAHTGAFSANLEPANPAASHTPPGPKRNKAHAALARCMSLLFFMLFYFFFDIKCVGNTYCVTG